MAVAGTEDSRSVGFERWWNVRDLGGLPIEGGGTTRRGVVFRGATPQYATPADREQAHLKDLEAFVDLRMPGHPSDWRDEDPRVRHIQVDLIGSLSRPADGAPEQLLRLLLDANRREVARAIGAISELANGSPPVLFHCHTGKDRTGLIAVVLLKLAGVPDSAVLDDYMASNPGFEAMRAAIAGDAPSQFMAGAPPAFRGPVVLSGAEGMLSFLEETGGATAYLASGGLEAPEIDQAASLLR